MITDKLKRLEDNLRSLSTFKNDYTLEDIRNDKIDEWGLRYGIFESVQLIIDLACSIVTSRNLGIPKNYSDCIQLLTGSKLLDKDLGERIKENNDYRHWSRVAYGMFEYRPECGNRHSGALPTNYPYGGTGE